MVPVDLPPDYHRPACIAPAWRADRPNTTESIVSDSYPIRVHWRRAQDAERAAIALEAAELAWAVQVEELGFQPPVLPDEADGDELDIYFAAVGAWEAYAEPGDYVDSQPGDGRNSTSAHIVIDRNLDLDWVASYTVHEFNHVAQFATDFSEDSLPIWESVAVASQHWTLGREEGLWDLDVAEFQLAPWAPVLLADGYGVSDRTPDGEGYLYEYGAALWVMHVDEILGDGDGRGGSALWDATANEGWSYEPDPVDAVQTVSGQSLGSFMNGVARTRWLTGDQWDERGLEVAREWGPAEAVVVDGALTTDDVGTDYVPVVAPAITGQAFIELDPTGFPADQELLVRAWSDAGLQSALLVMTWGADGALDVEASGDNPAVTVGLDGVERVVIALSNLGPTGWEAEEDPWVDGDQRILTSWVEPGFDEDDPDAVLPGDEREPSRACGCAASEAPLPWWALVLSVLGLRRRAVRGEAC